MTPEEKRTYMVAYRKKWYAKNRDKVIAKERARYASDKENILKYRKEWYVANRPRLQREARDKSRRSLYGMVAGEYDRMVAEQDGKCAICHEARRLVVDHDHSINGRESVRALLCDRCNTNIALLDSPLYEASLAYVESFRKTLRPRLVTK